MNGVDALNWLAQIKTHGAVYADAKGYCIEAVARQMQIIEECDKHLNCEESCEFWNHSCGAGCVFSTAPNRWR